MIQEKEFDLDTVGRVLCTNLFSSLFCIPHYNAVILHAMVVSYVISILLSIINICHILGTVWLDFLHCYFCSVQFIKICIVCEYRNVRDVFV
jgi:hypothetical protein